MCARTHRASPCATTSQVFQTFKYSQLRGLWIANSEITSIKHEIRALVNLRELGLSRNRIASLPKEIGDLEYLELLDVSCNLLTGLPEELKQCKALRTLLMNENEVSTIPNVRIARDMTRARSTRTPPCRADRRRQC